MHNRVDNSWTKLDWLLVIIGLLGVILLLLSTYVKTWAIPYSIILGLGSSAIISAILGFTIEKTLSRRLAQDAVEAGLGYLVLPEAREEMRRIYEQAFMCIHHETHLTLKGTQSPDYVLVRNHTVRRMKNITGKRQSYRPHTRYREWFFHNELRSRLTGFGLHIGSEEFTGYQTFISANSVQCELKNEVDVEKNQEFTFWYEIEEVKRTTDYYHETFTYPTVNPILTFAIDRGVATTNLNLGVWFGFPSNLESEVLETGKNRKEFQGLLLPYGYIELRWWDNDKIKDWRNEQSQKGIQIK